jgi:hypothetical protein
LVTGDAGATVGSQALKEGPCQVDFAGSAEGRGNPGGIVEAHHLRQEGVFFRHARGVDCEQCGERDGQMTTLESAAQHATSCENDAQDD